MPKFCAKITKSENPISPSPFRSMRGVVLSRHPDFAPNTPAKIKKSPKPIVPSPSKSGIDAVSSPLAPTVIACVVTSTIVCIGNRRGVTYKCQHCKGGAEHNSISRWHFPLSWLSVLTDRSCDFNQKPHLPKAQSDLYDTLMYNINQEYITYC